MINIRKLAALDMVLHSTRFIVAEFTIGIVLPLFLGLISIRAGFFGTALVAWQVAFGVWLVSIAANYIPLAIYAVLIARGGTEKQEGEPELAHAKRYGIQQVIILIPFLVVILALVQEGRRLKR
jgi:hypothetical protein